MLLFMQLDWIVSGVESVEEGEGGDRGDRYVLKQIARFFELCWTSSRQIELACCVVRRRLC